MSIALGWSESQENVCLSLVLNCQRILIEDATFCPGCSLENPLDQPKIKKKISFKRPACLVGSEMCIRDRFKGFSEQELVGIVSRDAMIGTGLIGPAK